MFKTRRNCQLQNLCLQQRKVTKNQEIKDQWVREKEFQKYEINEKKRNKRKMKWNFREFEKKTLKQI